ncbi:brachyurin [Anoplophora glabripennis]|uniref:Chymotrypsin BII n=1 Tax=Anoplophora glabripennis TaxID=217634 RepID=V5GS76_ANOGL|nr:brachyurin [Anoplophora glabripennis]
MIQASGLLIVLFVCSLSIAADWESFKERYVDLSPTIPRIIGGEEATPHEFPFQVALVINGNSFCGGSLISSNYVLTAAHCAIAITTVDVILGAHNVTVAEDSQVYLTGTEVILHENYNLVTFQNDIALIKLSESVTLNDYIQTVPLPSRNDANKTYDDEIVTSIGWGLTKDLDHTPTLRDISPVLRYVEVEVHDLDDCRDYYNRNIYNITYVTSLNICTSGYRNKGTCSGDSGGPLILNGVQIGLVSIGTTLCELCSPSVFTDLGKHLDWIVEHSDVVIQ